MGYIYHKFADKLGSTDLYDTINNEEYIDYFFGSESMCKAHAYENYNDAFELFTELNHLKGKALSKKMAAQVLTIDEDDEDSLELHSEIVKEAEECEEIYQNYCRRVGIKKSCHIPRKNDEEISLMTEIVFKEYAQPTNLFPDNGEMSMIGWVETPLTPLGLGRNIIRKSD